MAGGAGSVVVVKLTREGESALTTAWMAGVLPNLVCAAVVPLAPFLSRRFLRDRDFLGMTLFTAIGLCLYEFAQLRMPRRTFDWDDVAATAVGAMAAVVLGAGFFLFTGKKTITLPDGV
jgi:glycopeptide antibiotics resistance protein